MFDDLRLLVVDDEAVICQACRRVFVRQGFQVEECTDACEGLALAKAKDYAVILLDIKMPGLDGIRFLEELRKEKPLVPVILITGYPSIPNAASAIRLGASDYITKPFTPEEITQAVQRMLSSRDTNGNGKTRLAAAPAESGVPRESALLFFDESWCQLEEDGSACVGAVLGRSQGSTIRAVRLPQIGEAVYQGLPLAGLILADESSIVVPSPLSGVVVAVNESLGDEPFVLSGDPCGKGWIACVCTTRLEEEVKRCKPRRVILANADETSAREQSARLTFLGCAVSVAAGWEQLASALQIPDHDVVVFDAASFGTRGPELVGRINARIPCVKVVVVASAAFSWEAAYREQGVFYYAVEPFADNEIVDILDAVFRPRNRLLSHAKHWGPSAGAFGSIRITNRNGRKVHLLAAPGMLQRSEGLGWQIKHKLEDRMFPLVTTSGEADITPADILKTADTCDRLMVLLAKDTGRFPGSLIHDTTGEFVPLSEPTSRKITTLVVQPVSAEGGLAGLDERTAASLAEHIVQEMASC